MRARHCAFILRRPCSRLPRARTSLIPRPPLSVVSALAAVPSCPLVSQLSRSLFLPSLALPLVMVSSLYVRTLARAELVSVYECVVSVAVWMSCAAVVRARNAVVCCLAGWLVFPAPLCVSLDPLVCAPPSCPCRQYSHGRYLRVRYVADVSHYPLIQGLTSLIAL